jgi:hypothetical protein
MVRKIFPVFLVIFLILPVVVAAEDVYEEETFYGAPGFNSHRRYFNQVAKEYIDPYTGNLILTYTDIYLPGDGGLDLKIRRTYNGKIRTEKTGQWDIHDEDTIECGYAGIGWSLHTGRVYPIAQLRPTPAVEMPDGSVHPAFLIPNSSERQTKELWHYQEIQEADALYAYLTLNDGTIYRYRLSGTWKDESGEDVTKIGAPWYPVESITDVHGNQITITNVIKRQQFVIDEIRMAPGDRTATFTYFYSNEAYLPHKIQITVPGGQST